MRGGVNGLYVLPRAAGEGWVGGDGLGPQPTFPRVAGED
jgi:hypothetical protein